MNIKISKQQINMIKQGLNHVSKQLIERKSAMGNPKHLNAEETIVLEHLDDLVHDAGNAYLHFENIQRLMDADCTANVEITIKVIP